MSPFSFCYPISGLTEPSRGPFMNIVFQVIGLPGGKHSRNTIFAEVEIF